MLMPSVLSILLFAAPDSDAGARLVALMPPPALDALTPEQHAAIESVLRDHMRTLMRKGKLAPVAPAGSANLQWPLQPVLGFAPFDYYGTAYFVDHDPRFPSSLQDYMCGERTYDLDTGYNHGGTDYYLWPYPWLMMDDDAVRIVAAAPGVIIERIDGNFDRDCAIQGNGGFNAVFVRQDDGLVAWYLHMKNGSVTTLRVGDRVAAGDYLGIVGSSGPSSLPHLHFQLEDASGAVVDPRAGTCNEAPDRWIVLQPYESARIDTLTTHSAEPEFVDCGVADGVPVHEDPHFRDRFAPGDTVWIFAAYSDHRNGDVTHFSLLRPDGTAFASWDFDLASQNLERPFYSGTGWDWSYALPADAPHGTWKVRAEFADSTYEHEFEVAAAALRGHSTHRRPAR